MEFKKVTLSQAKRMSNRDLERAIYECYYSLNPDGDARFGVWGDVIAAKKSKDVKKALIRVLKTEGGLI